MAGLEPEMASLGTGRKGFCLKALRVFLLLSPMIYLLLGFSLKASITPCIAFHRLRLPRVRILPSWTQA
jgi:hypothetical protein